MPGRLSRRLATLAFLIALPATAGAITGNGKLQIHHVDVGQGDGMLLVSPNGQTALFDDGNYLSCTGIKNYLQGLGVTTVDYHFLSHYHSDHLGCIDDLAAIGITIGTAGYDRGNSYSSGTYTAYVNTLGAKRTTIAKNQVITLDAGSANPVTIRCVDLNGAGVYSVSGSDENSKSAVYKVSYGDFDEVIGGDLTGDAAAGKDVETTVGPETGDVEVYKVHHHGSRYSSNDNWLGAVTAEVAIVQCGNGNSYGHPTAEAMTRLHNHNVHAYWTETGAGATPDPAWDKVGGTIVVQADLATGQYTVSGTGFTDTYSFAGGPPPPLSDTQAPTVATMLQGTISAGSVTSLAVADAATMNVTSVKVGSTFATDWYGEATLQHPPTTLTVRYDGSYSTSRTQTLQMYNWGTSAWDAVDQATVSTSIVARTWTTSTPGAYVNGAGQVRMRVQANTRTRTYTCRADRMTFTYDYAAGTLITVTPEQWVTFADQAARDAQRLEIPQARVLDLAAVTAPGGVRLTWTVAANDHVDGFNVYREREDGTLEHVGEEAMLEATSDDVTFGWFDDAAPVAATYWLGARACSGPEAMLGPIRVDRAIAAPFAVSLAFAAAPNPLRTGPLTFSAVLPVSAAARLDVYDLSGRRVATPFTGTLPAGPWRLEWGAADGDGHRLPAGLYFARFESLGQSRTTRLTVLER